jgi:UDP-N-acetylmuramyl tripeptide synthase
MTRWLDSRRLIGPNIEWDRPGALLEVAGSGADFERCLLEWRDFAGLLLESLGWASEGLRVREYEGGALLILSAPVNALYTATEVAEAAWLLACGEGDLEQQVERLLEERDGEADPKALALYISATEKGKTCLVDEHGVSVGMGERGRFWPPEELPNPSEIEWSRIDDIPTALVTGTNGKTTTVRLLSAMVRESGLTAGLSSTDWIQVGDEVLDQGDYSGPGGAREVLRDPRTQVAILETARGGLLRRGLALERAAVAVVTNIGEDHLGDGGINTVDDLAEVKFMVTRVLGREGVAVLNADDARCLAHGMALPGPVAWFSLRGRPEIRPGDRGYWLDGSDMLRLLDGAHERIIAVADAPMTLGGGARHNVANALAAAAAAEVLGVPLAAVQSALRRFGSDINDNPGRANLVQHGGVRAILDFAHNPDGMQAIFEAGKALSPKRTAVVFGQAGDRTDEAIRDLTRAINRSAPDLYVIKEMAEYRRGRQPGEVPAIIQDELRKAGVPASQIVRAETEPEAAEVAFRWARPGDLLMLFIHSDRDGVLARLAELGSPENGQAG